MKTLLAAIIILLCSMTAQAWDRPQLEMSAGITHFQKSSNSIWWQEEFPNDFKMRSPSLAIGLKWKAWENVIGFDRINLRAGFEHLGRVRTWAKASASDEDYFSCRYHTERCWPLSTWHGKGQVNGIYLGVQPEIDMQGWSLFFDLAEYIYRPEWSVHIPDWRPTREGPVMDITATHNPKIQWTLVYGLGIRRGNFSLALNGRRATADGDAFPAAYQPRAYNMSLRYAF